MIMGDKSLSIVLYSNGVPFNPKTLQIWKKVALKYRWGCEIILLTFGEDVEVQDTFQSESSGDGLRIVSIETQDEFSFTYMMSLVAEYIEGQYVWVSDSRMYPNGDITAQVHKLLEPTSLIVLKNGVIKEPFDYSTVNYVTRVTDDYLQPPILHLESFVVSSDIFSKVAVLPFSSHVSGIDVSRLLVEYLGVNAVYDERASVFTVQD